MVSSATAMAGSRPVALIAGARGAIGSAVAQILAERGTDLWLGTRTIDTSMKRMAGILRGQGVRVEIGALDVTDQFSIDKWVEDARRAFGRIDAFANCVGWNNDSVYFRPFVEQDEGYWLAVLALELTGTMRLVRSVLPHMIQAGKGAIVILASESAKIGQGGIAANAAARGGCAAFCKSVAREVGKHQVTVNLVCPGPIESPVLERTDDATHRKMIDRLSNLIPMKRLGTTREVAEVIAFLLSRQASYVTGQAISVSGGLTMC